MFVQTVSPRLADDPTGTSVCTYGVLIDACVGSAAFRDPSNEQYYVGSRLSLNWAAPIVRGGELTVVSHLVSRDERAGTVLSAADIRQDGTLVGQALCRGIAIGTVESVLGNSDGAPYTPEDPSPEISRSLGLVLDDTDTPDDDRCGRWSPEPWMENGRADVQGGVVLAVACEVAERVGARLAGPGRIVSLLDIDVNILRAPSTTTPHDLVCRVVRMGRRIGVLEIEIRDGDRCLTYASAQVLVQ
ncbi:thioesterase family protein [Rhodococcus pyridinivorans]|uniref:PaaI family thioesterase n=1 Tax=Rhodococcus pyridinivorans TaxID=103816 RepID=UPI002226C25F|nr:acyl-CoA thioesterase domain-containing protein [Rhodococcus pyridinivorans]MCW3472640.1 thioesterase family protein [Rhodococcus pyridinivorans]